MYRGHLGKGALQKLYMAGCQNYDPFLGNLNIRCRFIIGIQEGPIILKTTHIRGGLCDSSGEGMGSARLMPLDRVCGEVLQLFVQGLTCRGEVYEAIVPLK